MGAVYGFGSVTLALYFLVFCNSGELCAYIKSSALIDSPIGYFILGAFFLHQFVQSSVPGSMSDVVANVVFFLSPLIFTYGGAMVEYIIRKT